MRVTKEILCFDTLTAFVEMCMSQKARDLLNSAISPKHSFQQTTSYGIYEYTCQTLTTCCESKWLEYIPLTLLTRHYFTVNVKN